MPVYRAFGVGSAAASVPSAPTKKYMTAEAVKKRYAAPPHKVRRGCILSYPSAAKTNSACLRLFLVLFSEDSDNSVGGFFRRFGVAEGRKS